MRYFFVSLFFVLLLSVGIKAQSIKIIDHNSKDSLPFATLYLKNGNVFAVADQHGIVDLTQFKIQAESFDSLFITYTGYKSLTFSFQLLWEIASDKVFEVPLELNDISLPPIKYSPPKPDSLLIYAAIHTLNQISPKRNWQQFKGRKYLYLNKDLDRNPIYLNESTGDLFQNNITFELISNARSMHRWMNKFYDRSMYMPEYKADYSLLFSDLFINYDLIYYFPFSPQYFDKTIEKVFDKDGYVSHYKITMVPESEGLLSKVRIAGNSYSLTYYNVLRNKRTFFIDVTDTTISELHVEDVKSYDMSYIDATQQYASLSYTFKRNEDGRRYLTTASRKVDWKMNKSYQRLVTNEFYWFSNPENASNMSLEAIQQRSNWSIRSGSFKTGRVYLFPENEIRKPMLNDKSYWQKIKMPDFPFNLSLYKKMANAVDYGLFSSN